MSDSFSYSRRFLSVVGEEIAEDVSCPAGLMPKARVSLPGRLKFSEPEENSCVPFRCQESCCMESGSGVKTALRAAFCFLLSVLSFRNRLSRNGPAHSLIPRH